MLNELDKIIGLHPRKQEFNGWCWACVDNLHLALISSSNDLFMLSASNLPTLTKNTNNLPDQHSLSSTSSWPVQYDEWGRCHQFSYCWVRRGRRRINQRSLILASLFRLWRWGMYFFMTESTWLVFSVTLFFMNLATSVKVNPDPDNAILRKVEHSLTVCTVFCSVFR